MSGVAIDTFGSSFIHYLPGVTDSLNNLVVFRKYARKGKKWEGSNLSFRVHVARNPGLGNIQDGGAFSVAGKQDYVEATVYRRLLQGSVQITDGILATAATTKHAAIDVVSSELVGMMEGIAKYEEFMAFRDGTGVVARLGTDVSGSAIGVTDARLLWDKGVYEVYDSADLSATGLRGTFTVSSVNRGRDANGDFVVNIVESALPSGSAANDYVVWKGALNIAITGLQSMIDDTSTTFQNISTSTYPRWTSPVLSNGGTKRKLTPNLYRQLMAMIKQESGGSGKVTNVDVMSNTWQGIEHEQLYEAELRLQPTDKEKGIDAPTFITANGRIRLHTCHDAPFNQIFFANFNEIYRGVQKELDWRRDKAGGIFRPSDTSAHWKATALEICEYYIKGRNKCGRIDDLTETQTTAY